MPKERDLAERFERGSSAVVMTVRTRIVALLLRRHEVGQMRGSLAFVVFFGCAACAFAPAVRAHHSYAIFDTTTVVTINGIVTDLAWRNPHFYVTVESTDENGETVLWRIEGPPLGPAQNLIGLRREMLAPGTPLEIRAHPGRRAREVAMGLDITTADGASYALFPGGRQTAPSPVAPSVPAEGIDGHWLSSEVGFAQIESWPWRQGVRAAELEASPSVCEAFSPHHLFVIPTLIAITTSESDNTVTLRFDSEHGVQERIIHLDRPARSSVEPSLLGHSVGRWEDASKASLLIETSAFAPHAIAVGGPTGPDKRTVEQLTLTDDRRALRYRLTVEDPLYLTDAASFEILLRHRPDRAFVNDGCDPETARRFLEE